MTKFLFVIITFTIYSCKQDKIIYSGFNDLVVGSQQVILYDDYRFLIELSMGGTEGNFKKSGDTIILFYDKKPSANWPDSLLLTKEYFILFDANTSHGRTRIQRFK